MKVLVALSGGVDSSVAAAELVRAGHHVVGVTMRLWGGDSDTGCCSVADVDDARRVAQQLDIDHLVFNFTEDFDRHVVAPYVDAHRIGSRPNPCIECNRHLKFARLAERADLLGFDAVATGHHARIVEIGGARHVARGADAAKDQSYVVHVLDQGQLARTLFPVGHLTKAEVRDRAAELGLRTADKPDSQDVCFITQHRRSGRRSSGRASRCAPLGWSTRRGSAVGAVDAVELVTVGQRRGLGLPGGGPKRYVVDVEAGDAPVVTVDDEAALFVDSQPFTGSRCGAAHRVGDVLVQCSAHGAAMPATIDATVRCGGACPQRIVAPGQSLVFYDPSDRYVLGAAIATRRPR